MSFSFNFFDSSEDTAPNLRDCTASEKIGKGENISVFTEVNFLEDMLSSTKNEDKLSTDLSFDNISLKYFHQDGSELADEQGKTTDLIAGVYEGGRKTWECSIYLAEYLSSIYQVENSLRGSSVLELGCGSALPGILTSMKGAQVDFQDYNGDVLENVTIPNLLLNLGGELKTTNYHFYAGDWSQFSDKMEKKYDLILTSETIYNTQNYPKLSRIFSEQLRQDGIIYLAAKNYYFGVGGGIDLFTEFLNNSKGKWKVETVKTIDENVKCSILKITRQVT